MFDIIAEVKKRYHKAFLPIKAKYQILKKQHRNFHNSLQTHINFLSFANAQAAASLITPHQYIITR
jgi:ribosome-associated toxin RatA of RatAB toxin-antitoxin module